MSAERSFPALPWVPQSCTLPPADRAPRVAEFDGLFRTSLRAARRLRPTVLRLTFDGSADVTARVSDLAERETGCCSFFTFTLARDAGDRLCVDVEVPAAYAEVLDRMRAQAEALAPGAAR